MLSLLGQLAALGTAFCWGVSPIIAYRGIHDLGIFYFSMIRLSIAAVVLGLICLSIGELQFENNLAYWLLIGSGVIGMGLGDVFMFQAVYLLGPRIASLSFSLHAPLTAVIGGIIFRDQLSLYGILGISTAMVGVYVATFFRSSQESAGGKWTSGENRRLGAIFMALAVVAQVLGAFVTKISVAEVHPITASFWRIIAGLVTFTPIFLIMRPKSVNFNLTALTCTAGSALLGMVVGVTLLLAALAYTEISRAAILSAMSPVFYILLMSTIMREKFPAGAWIGTAIAVAGIAIAIASS